MVELVRKHGHEVCGLALPVQHLPWTGQIAGCGARTAKLQNGRRFLQKTPHFLVAFTMGER